MLCKCKQSNCQRREQKGTEELIMTKNPTTIPSSESEALVAEIMKGLENTPESIFTSCQWGCDILVTGKRYKLPSHLASKYDKLKPILPRTKEYPTLRVIKERGSLTVEVVKANSN